MLVHLNAVITHDSLDVFFESHVIKLYCGLYLKDQFVTVSDTI